MPNLDAAIFKELVDLLTPYMADEADRRALLRLAVNDAAYLRIQFGGPADSFTVQMVSDLLRFGSLDSGQPAIIALLEVLHDKVGIEQQAKIKTLQQRLTIASPPRSLATVVCRSCGASNRLNASFCHTCGRPLSPIHHTPSYILGLRKASFVQKNRSIALITAVVIVVAVFWLGVMRPLFSSPILTGAETPVKPMMTATSPAPTYPLDALAGAWQVSRQDQYGSSLVDWDIQINRGVMTIEEFHQDVPGVPLPGDYRRALPLTDVTFDGRKLAFTTTGSGQGVTEKFDLTLITADRMEGAYTSTNTALSDTGIIQGKTGIIKTTGKAILLRKE